MVKMIIIVTGEGFAKTGVVPVLTFGGWSDIAVAPCSDRQLSSLHLA